VDHRADQVRELLSGQHRPPQRISMDLLAEITSAITRPVKWELLLDPPL
jgi:hypothetical protein